MRYFLHLSYRGTAYRGWQKQSNTSLSIQSVIENAIQKMTGGTMSLMGCGRTDAGVHAKQFFAHFDYDGKWTFDPVVRLNRMLPHDIAVHEIISVDSRAHARYDAVRRSYEYHIHLERNPYLEPVSAYFEVENPNIEALKNGLLFIKNLEDFRHLCLTPDRFKNTLCTIYEADLEVSNDGKRICFRFTANRFLKSMIRIIVARLMALGEGKISLDTFKDTSMGNQNLKFKTLAYPQGLHLAKIIYPYMERDVKVTFLL